MPLRPHTLRPLALRALSCLLIVALLTSSLAPASAQDGAPGGGSGGGSIFLPLVSGGQGPGQGGSPGPLAVYRTDITVNTPAHWQTLARIAPVILARGDNWAQVLVDDEQLADLARLRFNPEGTNALTTLARAGAANGASLPAAVLGLAEQVAAAGEIATDSADQAAARAALRSRLGSLPAADLAAVAAANSVDTDADGLTDDQEFFWCTVATRADSDYDQMNDGAEVVRLKAWMNNETFTYPRTNGTSTPFLGWPRQIAGCTDSDKDSVPDLAEINELGLSAQRESTDRDKFDDGQELFGITDCTGEGGYCSYGPLPRNEDWGVIFAEMPAWVKAPGDHPLVAAFPVPQIDIIDSSLQLEVVTTITTDHTIISGTQQSYGTARTDGTSVTVENTVTWNEWEEVSISQPVSRGSAVNLLQLSSVDNVNGLPAGFKIAGGSLALLGSLGAIALCTGPQVALCAGVALLGVGAGTISLADGFAEWDDEQQAQSQTNVKQPCNPQLQSCVGYNPVSPSLTPIQPTETKNQEFGRSTPPMSYTQEQQQGSVAVQRLYQIEHPLPPTPTKTESRGAARGGAQSTAVGEYEEHTVTNVYALSSEESWGNATAADSGHAADMWFSYKVRNKGTEFAREICNLTFNIYIGDDPYPVYTYFVPADRGGACFSSFDPDEEHVFSARTNTHSIPLTLEQVKTIDLGGPIRIVVEDFSYNIDERFYFDAANSSLAIAVEDGTYDGDESTDTYLIPTWGSETVYEVLARYFPHETDANGTIVAIWTPEYRGDTPSWCQSPRRPSDQPSKVVWCKHALSTAEWWNVYTDGLGDGSEGFQDTQAVPGATALFRFNQDSDLDGFSDRTEVRLGTVPNDATSFPHPELLGGLHSIRAGSKVTSTLSLLNRGVYDAYGVEAVMVAPDDSITIDNNTVGGSGRVRALKQVIVGSRVLLQTPLPAPWLQANHAVPAAAGYFTGTADALYTFTVANCPAGGCQVGAGSWTLNWSGGGKSGSLNFGGGYQSPTFQNVAQGVTLALYSGSVQGGESFTVNANTPRDTFQYTINRQPYTPPLVIVSYNDPQGNHRFLLPTQAMSLTLPTDDLRAYAGQMLGGVGVEMVTDAPFVTGTNTLQLLVNNPSASTLQGAHLFLEFIDITGTVVSEVPTQVNLPPGPTYTAVNFDSGSFSPPFNAQQDYIVMAFLTDYQGNILDTAGRPLSSFQADPLPELAYDPAALTWNFGAAAQGALLKRPLALANVGYGALSLYLGEAPGLSLAKAAAQVGGADLTDYELLLATADLPVGAYDQTVAIKTSDPAQPSINLRVQGSITAATGDSAGGAVQRPLDWPVTLDSGNVGDWVDFTHTLGPDPQTLHPVKVYSQDYATVYGVGKYATDFGQGTASYDMFGDGRDGVMPSSGNLDNENGTGVSIVNSGSAGAMSINVTDVYGGWRVDPGDVVFIHQTQGTGAGCWELNTAVSDIGGGAALLQLAKPLKCTYSSEGSNRAQMIRVPQYSTCNVTGTVTPLYAWNGSTGGILAVMCSGKMTVAGSIVTDGQGYRGGEGGGDDNAWTGEGNESVSLRNVDNPPGNGGGEVHVSCAGGGNGTAGGSGGEGTVGDPAGNPELSIMVMGGGGGGGAVSVDYARGPGGSGAGIAVIIAQVLDVTGGIFSRGINGGNVPPEGRSGCGGAGGSVFVRGRQINLGGNGIVATGGVRGTGGNGSNSAGGGAGRIRLE